MAVDAPPGRERSNGSPPPSPWQDPMVDLRLLACALARVVFVAFIGLAFFAPRVAQAAGFQLPEPVLQTSTRQFEGRVDLRIATMFDGTSDLGYWLVTDWEAVRLDVTPKQYPELQRRAVIRAHGKRTGDASFHVTSLDLLAPPPAKLIDPEPRPARRIATLMVHFGSPDGADKEDFKSRMFTGATSTNTYYQQISYGKETLVGDVFGWFELPRPTGCDGGVQTIAVQAKAAMRAAGHATDEFTQFMFYFPRWSSCGWSGLASVGDPDDTEDHTWYNGSFGCVVRNQELGHNYGMLHSHSYECQGSGGQDVPYSDDCTFREYGSPYDPMGGGCGHMTVAQKGFMSWLEECNTVETSSDGTFNLLPLELPCNGAQALKIPIDENLNYFLEYRRPLGAWDGDINANGVLVHVAPDYDNYYFGTDSGPYILDMNINGSGMFMHAGDSYDDHLGRVSFSVVEETASHAVIRVTYPGGGDGADPTCQDGITAPPQEGGNWGSLECLPAPIGQDLEAPTVRITYPADQEVFEVGASFSIEVEAMDDRRVTDVELYVDGAVFFKDFEDPWEFWVDQIPQGTYEFGVIAQDGTHWTPSEPVTIYVGEEPPPVPPGGTTGTTGEGTDGGGSGTSSGTGGASGGASDGATTATDGSGSSSGAGATDSGGSQTGGGDGCACTAGNWGSPIMAWVGLVLAAVRRRRSD